jgi:perosamine synthetase
MDKPIPVYAPSLGEQEWQNVRQCLESTWISSRGEFITRFEKAFADYVEVEHALSVCNGTVAVHLVLLGLGIGPGDKVAVPSFTFIASVNPIRYVGAAPVFVDSHPTTLQLCPQDLARRLRSIACVRSSCRISMGRWPTWRRSSPSRRRTTCSSSRIAQRLWGAG